MMNFFITILLLTILVICLTTFSSSPPKSGGTEAPALISPQELQAQINAVLLKYGKPEITVDGVIGHRTASAYYEAYDLQETQKIINKDYE